MDKKKEEEAMQAPALAKANRRQLFSRPVAIPTAPTKADWILAAGSQDEPALLHAARQSVWTLLDVVPGVVTIGGAGIPAIVDWCFSDAWVSEHGVVDGYRFIERNRTLMKGAFMTLVITRHLIGVKQLGKLAFVPGVALPRRGCLVSARGVDFMEERHLDAFRLRVLHFLMRTLSLQPHKHMPGHPCAMEPPASDIAEIRRLWVALGRRERPLCRYCGKAIRERYDLNQP